MKNFAKAAAAGIASVAYLQTPLSLADSAYDDRGWYVGGEFSHVRGEAEIGRLYKLDEEGLGLGVYGGYNFSNWFGLEGTVFQSNDMSDDREDLANAYYSSLSFMPKFTLNVSDTFGLFVKAGPTFVLYTEEYDDYYYDRRYWDDEADWSEVLFGAGAGAQIKLENGIRLRVAYDYTSGTLDETWDTWDAPSRRVDVTLERVSFGVHYQF